MTCPKCGNPGGAYSTHVCVSGWVNTSLDRDRFSSLSASDNPSVKRTDDKVSR